MTKKHFIELADYLRLPGMMPAAVGHTLQAAGVDDLDCLVQAHLIRAISEELADFCQSQNPRFDRARWLAYIAGTHGPNGGKLK